MGVGLIAGPNGAVGQFIERWTVKRGPCVAGKMTHQYSIQKYIRTYTLTCVYVEANVNLISTERQHVGGPSRVPEHREHMDAQPVHQTDFHAQRNSAVERRGAWRRESGVSGGLVRLMM